MTAPRRTELETEVKDLIAFYEERGWDWVDALTFTLMRAQGWWPMRWSRGGWR